MGSAEARMVRRGRLAIRFAVPSRPAAAIVRPRWAAVNGGDSGKGLFEMGRVSEATTYAYIREGNLGTRAKSGPLALAAGRTRAHPGGLGFPHGA